MHIIGVGGQMRRIYNPMQYEFLQHQQHWNVFMTYGALLLGLTVHQKLGYAAMSLVIAIVVASMTLALVGAALAIRAHRSGSGPVRALVSGTVVAAAPLVLLLGAWILGR